MLQQTRVAAVLDHYARFMRRFPAVESLAAAREASVLALWSGLGYYHRARRMHQAAKVIVRQGSFPRTAQDWSELPGIGRYTAAAIASIAFGEPVAVVDGNVERVLQRLFPRRLKSAQHEKNKKSGAAQLKLRLFKATSGRESVSGEGKEATWQQAEALLDRKRPGDFNQAMMELGATICTPRAPQCLICPVHSFCETQGEEERGPAPARKLRETSYALARKGSSLLLVQRPADASLMAGMWELPSLLAGQVNGDAPLLRVRHSITDTDYRISVFELAPEQLQESAGNAKWFTAKQWQRLPLTGLTRKILSRMTLASTEAAAVSK
jgi:A/G-specific adenine glycosylase